jgi:hypothetical protein
MTTLLPRRTQMTVVERMRGARADSEVWKEESPRGAANEEIRRVDMLFSVYRPLGGDLSCGGAAAVR